MRNRNEQKNGRYNIQLDHGFRKRFITILKSNNQIPVAYAERLAGHKVYTDTIGNKIQLDDSYLRPDLEKLFSFFELAISELTIDQTNRLKLETELQQKKISVLQQKEKEDESIKAQMAKMQQELEELKYGQAGRKNRYNQARLDAPDAKLATEGLALLIELALPEEKRRAMLKEFEQAKLENRTPDLYGVLGITPMDKNHKIELLQNISKSPPSVNTHAPRLDLKRLLADLH